MNTKLFGLRKIALLVIVHLFASVCANATTLPPYIIEAIKTELPNANIRFDGLIGCPNGVIYLPVLPSEIKKNPAGKIVSTYPINQKLSQYPEVVLFDSNFALLKVVKNKDGQPTVTDSKNIPFVIKTGLFPQDLLVPSGLVIPEDMKIMLGDLNIKVVRTTPNKTVKGIVRMATESKQIVPVPYLSEKTLLATTLDSKLLYFIPSEQTAPLFSLELPNLPKFIQPVEDDKYILVASAGKTYIDVADVQQELFAKKIDLGYQPTEIILNKDKTKAYVAVENDQSIFVIDIKTMSLLEKIKIKGYPKHITLTADNSQIAYIDRHTGDIYTLDLGEVYTNKYVYNASNVSKLILKDDILYVLSRTENNLHVIDTKIKDIIYKQSLGSKPVDMLLYNNKLYILCGSNQMDIFNLEDFSHKTSVKLAENGFTKKMEKVDDNIILITNVTDKSYTVYDLTTESILQKVNTTLYINDLKVMNKRIK